MTCVFLSLLGLSAGFSHSRRSFQLFRRFLPSPGWSHIPSAVAEGTQRCGLLSECPPGRQQGVSQISVPVEISAFPTIDCTYPLLRQKAHRGVPCCLSVPPAPSRMSALGLAWFWARLGPSVALPRVDPRGERRALARVPLLHQGVPQAQWPGAPYPHPHPWETLQVPPVLPGLRCEEHADRPHQDAHGHQGLQVPVLHEELLHLGEPQGAHSPAHRCAGTVGHRGSCPWGSRGHVTCRLSHLHMSGSSWSPWPREGAFPALLGVRREPPWQRVQTQTRIARLWRQHLLLDCSALGWLSAVEAWACGMPATGLGLCCDCGHRWWATWEKTLSIWRTPGSLNTQFTVLGFLLKIVKALLYIKCSYYMPSHLWSALYADKGNNW